MFAIGHFALGYLTGKGASKLTKTKIHLPLILLASVLPDVDLVLENLFSNLFAHRGFTHSIIISAIAIIPILIIFRKRAVPYVVAYLSHALIGDFFSAGVMLFWPISTQWIGLASIVGTGLISLGVEVVLFVVSLPLMFYFKDLQSLFKPNDFNWFLIVPFVAVLGPVVTLRWTFGGSSLAYLLLIPSIFWLIVMGISLLLQLKHTLTDNSPAEQQIPKKQQPMN